MKYPIFPYRIFPLGDTALTVDFGNMIDAAINKEVIQRFNQLLQQPVPGMIEAIPAYSSLTVYYNVMELKNRISAGTTIFEWMKQQIEQRLALPGPEETIIDREVSIPVCYEDEMAADIRQLAAAKNMTIEKLIAIHTATKYKVYMLGFIPGFAYMGEVDEAIAMPRKPQPKTVPAGAVGIAGKQTGVYPLSSPGGWHIIGQTPVTLFKAERKEPALLRAGDTIQFFAINKKEFERIHATEALKH